MLFDLVCSHMNLIEGDYFGLEFQNHQKMMVSEGEDESEIEPLPTHPRFSVAFIKKRKKN